MGNCSYELENKCSQCGKEKETSSEIVYSQGKKVCIDCKQVNQGSDNRAFDRDMGHRIYE